MKSDDQSEHWLWGHMREFHALTYPDRDPPWGPEGHDFEDARLTHIQDHEERVQYGLADPGPILWDHEHSPLGVIRV